MPNKSELMCVVRLSGTALDVDAIMAQTALSPYRVDRMGAPKIRIGALHYDLSDVAPVTPAELNEAIAEFVERNSADLRLMAGMSGVEDFTLDVGVTIDEGMATREITLPSATLRMLSSVGLSLTFSFYGQIGTA